MKLISKWSVVFSAIDSQKCKIRITTVSSTYIFRQLNPPWFGAHFRSHLNHHFGSNGHHLAWCALQDSSSNHLKKKDTGWRASRIKKKQSSYLRRDADISASQLFYGSVSVGSLTAHHDHDHVVIHAATLFTDAIGVVTGPVRLHRDPARDKKG